MKLYLATNLEADESMMCNKDLNSFYRSWKIIIPDQNLRRIAKIRSYLTEEATIALVHAFITCRLDYGNALLFGLPKYQIQRLQSILNCAARLVKRHSKFDRALPLLFELHWLPVEQRITFKILLFVFKSLNGLAPFYLSDLISTYWLTISMSLIERKRQEISFLDADSFPRASLF